MPRPIDADALESNGICFTVYGGAKFISLESVRTAPTIEAEPVKHGRWVRYLDFWRKCSLCGSSWHEQWVMGKTLNYCPNCGAKMDG